MPQILWTGVSIAYYSSNLTEMITDALRMSNVSDTPEQEINYF